MRRRRFLEGTLALGLGGAPACSTGGVPLWFSYGGKNREALLALVERFNR